MSVKTRMTSGELLKLRPLRNVEAESAARRISPEKRLCKRNNRREIVDDFWPDNRGVSKHFAQRSSEYDDFKQMLCDNCQSRDPMRARTFAGRIDGRAGFFRAAWLKTRQTHPRDKQDGRWPAAPAAPHDECQKTGLIDNQRNIQKHRNHCFTPPVEAEGQWCRRHR